MLLTQDLTYQYKNGQVLSFPDIRCSRGEHFLLLGQSGSGKTTMLQLLSGLRKPRTGIIKIGETEINRLNPSDLDRFRGQNIGLIFQTSHFIKSLTVGENVAIAQSLAGRKSDLNSIKSLLDQLNIVHKINHKTYELSQGEQQRVAIARAIINEPQVILADEPTSALDDANTAEVVDLLSDRATAVNATLIIVTHDNRLKDKFTKRIEL